jgi:hypothetical protein
MPSLSSKLHTLKRCVETVPLSIRFLRCPFASRRRPSVSRRRPSSQRLLSGTAGGRRDGMPRSEREAPLSRASLQWVQIKNQKGRTKAIAVLYLEN